MVVVAPAPCEVMVERARGGDDHVDHPLPYHVDYDAPRPGRDQRGGEGEELRAGAVVEHLRVDLRDLGEVPPHEAPGPCIWSTRETTSLDGWRRMSLTFSKQWDFGPALAFKIVRGITFTQPTPLHNGPTLWRAMGPPAMAFG